MRRTLLSTTCALAAGLVVSGCSGIGPIRDTPKDVDGTDVQYLKDVITSNQRALILSKIAAKKTENSTALHVNRDTEAQAEISMLSEYTKALGESADARYDPTVHAAEADDPLVRGKNEVDALTALTGSDFDRAFLLTIAAHNKEYIKRAEKQLDTSSDELVLELARSIVRERRLDNAGIESPYGDR